MIDVTREKSPYAGMTVKARDGNDFIVEDWWQNLSGESWMTSDWNPVLIEYSARVAMKNLPIDDEVLYGKIDSTGYLYHVSELELPEVS